jgi:prevent-host-death family protein
MTYTVHQTKTNLSRILKEVEAGKEVTIARGKVPIAKIVPARNPRPNRKPGTFKGKISWSAGAFDPLGEEELKEWGLS